MASSLVPINFIIDNFNTEIQLDVCGNLFKSVVTMDASAVADLKVDASLVRLAFQIQTDASQCRLVGVFGHGGTRIELQDKHRWQAG